MRIFGGGKMTRWGFYPFYQESAAVNGVFFFFDTVHLRLLNAEGSHAKRYVALNSPFFLSFLSCFRFSPPNLRKSAS